MKIDYVDINPDFAFVPIKVNQPFGKVLTATTDGKMIRIHYMSNSEYTGNDIHIRIVRENEMHCIDQDIVAYTFVNTVTINDIVYYVFARIL